MDDKIPEVNKRIGLELKRARKNSFLSQSELAEKISERYERFISKDVLYKAESGKSIVPGWLICAYSDLLNKNIADLLGEDLTLGNNKTLTYRLNPNVVIALNELDQNDKSLSQRILINCSKDPNLTLEMSKLVSKYKDNEHLLSLVQAYNNNPGLLNDLISILNKYITKNESSAS